MEQHHAATKTRERRAILADCLYLSDTRNAYYDYDGIYSRAERAAAAGGGALLAACRARL